MYCVIIEPLKKCAMFGANDTNVIDQQHFCLINARVSSSVLLEYIGLAAESEDPYKTENWSTLKIILIPVGFNTCMASFAFLIRDDRSFSMRGHP